jgi:hypothetical protein
MQRSWPNSQIFGAYEHLNPGTWLSPRVRRHANRTLAQLPRDGWPPPLVRPRLFKWRSRHVAAPPHSTRLPLHTLAAIHPRQKARVVVRHCHHPSVLMAKPNQLIPRPNARPASLSCHEAPSPLPVLSGTGLACHRMPASLRSPALVIKQSWTLFVQSKLLASFTKTSWSSQDFFSRERYHAKEQDHPSSVISLRLRTWTGQLRPPLIDCCHLGARQTSLCLPNRFSNSLPLLVSWDFSLSFAPCSDPVRWSARLRERKV